MRKIMTVLIVVVAIACVFTTSGCASRKVLFNGKNFDGWKFHVADKSVDVSDVWSVKDGVVHCKGQPRGYMRTADTYSNYKLHVEWRWVDEPTNSGVLLHASGPEKVWPRCIESQLKTTLAGDFVLIGKTGIEVDGKFHQDLSKEYVIVAKKQASSEKPAGQWNSYDIECIGGTIRNTVNGVLQNYGVNATERSGWICLQSEGSPIEFRNIYIERVK
jgi:hypothetical protein